MNRALSKFYSQISHFVYRAEHPLNKSSSKETNYIELKAITNSPSDELELDEEVDFLTGFDGSPLLQECIDSEPKELTDNS